MTRFESVVTYMKSLARDRVDELKWIGSRDGTIWMDWKDFEENFSEVPCLNRPGGSLLNFATNLVLVGDRWWIDLDGSSFSPQRRQTAPRITANSQGFTRITQHFLDGFSHKRGLKELQEIDKDPYKFFNCPESLCDALKKKKVRFDYSVSWGLLMYVELCVQLEDGEVWKKSVGREGEETSWRRWGSSLSHSSRDPDWKKLTEIKAVDKVLKLWEQKDNIPKVKEQLKKEAEDLVNATKERRANAPGARACIIGTQEFVSLAEAARIYRVSSNTIRRWIKEGKTSPVGGREGPQHRAYFKGKEKS